MKILVAEASSSPLESEDLRKERKIVVTHNGKQCLAHLENNKIDVLLIDLALPFLDAYDIITKIRENHIPVKVIIVMVYSINSVISKMLNNLGVDYIVMKPYDANSLLLKMETLLLAADESTSQEDYSLRHQIEEEVTNILHEIGIPASIQGHTYLRTAIIESYYDISKIHRITKDLYPFVAEQYKTTTSRVERSIRHAIEIALNRGNYEVIRSIFGYTMSYEKSKPTNSEFVAQIVDNLRMKYKNQSVAVPVLHNQS